MFGVMVATITLQLYDSHINSATTGSIQHFEAVATAPIAAVSLTIVAFRLLTLNELNDEKKNEQKENNTQESTGCVRVYNLPRLNATSADSTTAPARCDAVLFRS